MKGGHGVDIFKLNYSTPWTTLYEESQSKPAAVAAMLHVFLTDD